MKVALVSLGCSRTLVDSEVALGGLAQHGYRIVRDVKDADVAIVNTCGFIEEAKVESIETILELCRLKKKGKLEGVVVLGCLAQRYGEDLRREIQEADAIVGTNNYGDLAAVLEPLKKRKKVYQVEPKPYYLLDENTPRYSLTPDHLAYVKISEGCINACSYCVIPKMKGPHRSRSVDSILREIEKLASERKLSEIDLIGQDTAAFGYDVDKIFRLPELLNAVGKQGAAEWIRLLYAHPGHVTGAMIEAMASQKKICKYVDLPIEHSHDAMLQRMNRQVTRQQMIWAIREFRKMIPSVAIRTTVIVGFPGETEEEFQDLLAFLEEFRFEKLGAFIYSPEEGSRAVHLADPIADELKKERFEAVMELQREISSEIGQGRVGQTLRVLVEEKDRAKGLYRGRTEADAPDVDGQIRIRAAADLKAGDFIDVRVVSSSDYDLEGEAIGPVLRGA